MPKKTQTTSSDSKKKGSKNASLSTLGKLCIHYHDDTRSFADWLSWQCRSRGYEVVLKLWDPDAGKSFSRTVKGCLRYYLITFLLLSDAYVQSMDATTWTSAMVKDDIHIGDLCLLKITSKDVSKLMVAASEWERPLHDISTIKEKTAVSRIFNTIKSDRRRLADRKPKYPDTFSQDHSNDNTTNEMTPNIQESDTKSHKVTDLEVSNTDTKDTQTTHTPDAVSLQHIPYNRIDPFIGRQSDLAQLDNIFSADSHSVQVGVITGMLGVGKSSLALEYIWQNKSKYEVIWWFDASTLTSLEIGFSTLAERLGVGGGDDVQQNVTAVLDYLGNGGSYLFVFDGVGHPTSIQAFLPPDLGHVLITSSNPTWDFGTSVHLREWTIEEALTFWFALWPDEDEQKLDTLSHRLGLLPAACGSARGFIQHSSDTVTLSSLMDAAESYLLQNTVLLPFSDTLHHRYQQIFSSLEDTLSIKWKVLIFLAFLSSDMLHRDIIFANPFFTQTLDLSDNIDDVNHALDHLLSCGLIEYENNHIFISPITSFFVKNHLDLTDQQEWTSRLIDMMFNLFTHRDQMPLPLSDILPHAMALIDSVKKELLDDRLPNLLHVIAIALKDEGYLDDAVSYFQETLTFLEGSTVDHSDVQRAAVLNNLGLVYLDLGDLDHAVEIFNQSKQLKEAHFDAEDIIHASSLNNLGKVFMLKKQFSVAIDYFNASLELKKAHYGPHDSRTTPTYQNLAEAYYGYHQFSDALRIYQELRSSYESVGDTHSLSYWSSVLGVADSQFCLEAYDKALPDLLTLRSLYRSMNESDPYIPDDIESRIDYRLGVSYVALDRLEDARNHLEQALEGYTAMGSAADHSLIPILLELGILARQMGNIDEAATYLTRAYDYTLSNDHHHNPSDNVSVAYELSKVYRHLRKDTDELRCLEAAMQFSEHADDRSLVDVVNVLIRLGAVYASDKRFNDAEESLQSATYLLSKMGKETSPEMGHSLMQQGQIFDAQDNVESALTTFKEAGRMFRSLYGNHHILVAKSMYFVALMEKRLDHLDSACHFMSVAITLFSQLTDDGALLWKANALNGLGSILLQRKEFSNAYDTFEKARDTYGETVGDMHRYVGVVAHNQAMAAKYLGRRDDEERLKAASAVIFKHG